MKLNNRFIFGILSLVLAAVIAFVALPTIARQTNGKAEIIRITQPVLKGEKITSDNTEVVEVGGYNLPSNVAHRLSDVEGLYVTCLLYTSQARVIAVAEKVIRVEVFGVECSILARDLAWDWIGDAHERFAVGDEVLVRILSVRRNSLEDLGIRADIKSTSENTDRDNLQKCRIQGKYAGKVTDVHKGVVYVRLANGVNAVAHSCYDYRMPGKKADVSFAVTRLDMERGVAVGIITRIIRQNL